MGNLLRQKLETIPTKMAMETAAIDPRPIIANLYEKKN
jgi:hypothetical protein